RAGGGRRAEGVAAGGAVAQAVAQAPAKEVVKPHGQQNRGHHAEYAGDRRVRNNQRAQRGSTEIVDVVEDARAIPDGRAGGGRKIPYEGGEAAVELTEREPAGGQPVRVLVEVLPANANGASFRNHVRAERGCTVGDVVDAERAA